MNTAFATAGRPVSAARQSSARKRANASHFGLESLEGRQMMAAQLLGNTLTITGRDLSGSPDTYTITQDATFIHVTENGVLKNFFQSQVASIKASLLAGDDKLTCAANVTKPLIADGGMGNDTIIGGSANDTITGNGGKDSLYGMAGNDYVDGGVGGVAVYAQNTGDDYVDGGTGDDTLHASDFGNCYLNGGAGNDSMYGWNGNDYLVGGDGNDYMSGYRGNDVLVGGAGDDTMQGGGGDDGVYGTDGNDVLDGGTFGAGLVADNNGADIVRGGAGNDTLYAADYSANRLFGDDGDDTIYGYAGNDYINGGAGIDKMYGGDGDDTIIAVDGNLFETVVGGAGNDVVWGDKQVFIFGISFTDSFTDASAYESSHTTRMVTGFANGADKSFDHDNIADPTDGSNYKNFSNKPLFASWGPTDQDIDQEALGDCWIMAPLAAVAQDNPLAIRSMVVDFGDGTYGVSLGNSFYRVDADLPTWSPASTDQTFAGLGQQGSLWVAIVEKAYAAHRTGSNTYAALNGGDPADSMRQIGATSVGQNYYAPGSNATTLANDIFAHWNAYQSADICTGSVVAGSPLVGNHCYTVTAVWRDGAGNVTTIRVRNPWGPDNTSGNPYIDLTPSQIAVNQIWVTWGNT